MKSDDPVILPSIKVTPMMKKPTLTGVVMAGGKSKRMGRDKGAIRLGNKYLVQYSIDTLKPLCSQILISTQNEWYAQFGYPLVQDVVKDCGPIGGIYSSLLRAETQYILILACDMPFVDRPILEKLIENIRGKDCVVPRTGNQYEPLCALYSKSLIPDLEQRINASNYTLQSLIMESDHCFVDFGNDSSSFRNLNTEDELKRSKGNL